MTEADKLAEGEKAEGEAFDDMPGLLPLRPGSFSAAELAEMERRDRMTGWLLAFFTGAALGTAALAFYIFSDDVEQNEDYVRYEGEEPVEADDTPFIWGVAEEEPEPLASPEPSETPTGRTVAGNRKAGEPAPAATPSPEQQFTFPGPPEEPAAPVFSGPPAGSVDRETARALRSGKAQLWNEDGQRGYVLVSAPVAYGTRECRQVSYSLITEGRQVTSPSTQWCRIGKTGKWRPDPRGPG